MSELLLPTLIVAALGLICAIILVIASKVMAVKENENYAPIRGALPGANCGACGYAGCDAYAKALAEGIETKTNLCIPGSDSVAAEIAGVLGVEAEDVIEMVAVVHCGGNCEKTTLKMDYMGADTCKAKKLYFGGTGACSFGCLGSGDCMEVCPQNAIHLDHGIAHIDPKLCVGCALCAKTCPNGVISLIPQVSPLVVTCSNHDKGAATRKACTVGCIGCMKCQKTCPEGAITVVNNLAVVDYEKCVNCGACVDACPTKCLNLSNLM